MRDRTIATEGPEQGADGETTLRESRHQPRRLQREKDARGKRVTEGRKGGDEIRALGISRPIEGEVNEKKREGRFQGRVRDEAPSPLEGVECTEYM